MRTVFDRSERTKGLLVGACVGSAIGAILALLYAPTSGRELRHNVKAKTSKLVSEAEEILKNAKRHTSEVVLDAKKKLAGEKTRLKEAVRAGVDAYKQEVNRV